MELTKKMEPETALKELAKMKEAIIGENILDLLESDKVKKEVDDAEPGKYLQAAVVGGLVYLDEDGKTLVQKLINPIVSGEQSRDVLHYKNRLTLDIIRDEQTGNEIAQAINIVTRLTGCTKQLIGKLCYQDLYITQEIAAFFFAH
jgi:antitoxin component HigA of HigAB toxin-antitoxin module